jgi:YD repeat-containing protein
MLNRPKVVTWADTSTTTLTWDAGNRLTQLVDTISGTITRSWDDLDRLSFEQTPQGRIDYTYDNAGRRQTMTVLGQPSVVYGWDDADRLQSVTQGAAVVLLGYDNANRRTTVTFPNGILATSGHAGHVDLHHGCRRAAELGGRHLGPDHAAPGAHERHLQCQ